jgi:hypothetical protein
MATSGDAHPSKKRPREQAESVQLVRVLAQLPVLCSDALDRIAGNYPESQKKRHSRTRNAVHNKLHTEHGAQP